VAGAALCSAEYRQIELIPAGGASYDLQRFGFLPTSDPVITNGLCLRALNSAHGIDKSRGVVVCV
jgi:NADH:ubiquinone oxidoreductase subunit B-like Fe-S oxidoreductase